MAITKNKADIIERITQREIREDRYFSILGGYYYDGGWGHDDYYDNLIYDHCYRGYSDCTCEQCVEVDYTTIKVKDIFDNIRMKCIPAGKEWFRKSQIDALLSIDEPDTMTLIHSKLIESGLVA